MFSVLKRILIGRPLRTEQLNEERLPIWKALPILSSDALSSLAYGTQHLLSVLVPFGMLAAGYSLPLTAGIVALLALLILSYRQVVAQYPGGGGAYVVATKNLGWRSGLVAGAALLIDYVLTCAVSVTSGTDAIIAALQPDLDLRPYRVVIASTFILLVMLLNLRGLRESGTIFAFPTYLFVTAMALMVGVGLWKTLVLGEGVQSISLPSGDLATSGLTWLVLLRAFSSGCAALTGIEAIANATPTFQPPESKRAIRTLTILGLLLGILLVGVALLTHSYGLLPENSGHTGQTLLSQINELTFGRGPLYYAIQAATALILILAANTAFSSFPLLANIMAKDGFMPRMFAIRGDRLNFSNGIVVLALTAIALVVFFRGDLNSLIPLYSIGVFLSFTLSQLGMVCHWWSTRPAGWFPRCCLNAVGGVVFLVVLSICAITKFTEGAWIVLILLPLLVLTFYRIHLHYDDVSRQLHLPASEQVPIPREHLIVVPVSNINRVVMSTLAYARGLNGKIVAVHVAFEEEAGKRFAKEWQAWQDEIRLVVVHSRLRSMVHPLLRFIDHLDRTETGRSVTVLIPEFVTTRWWHRILHNQSAFLIRFMLLLHKNVVVSTVPFRLKREASR